jgi:succinate-semialdehyde dehydrogenase/glutarate-semialdehyde dehydrogenase
VASINPSTGMLLAEHAPHSPAELDRRISEAHAAQRAWRDAPISDRARALAQVGAALRARRDELARLATLEMGKPITQAEAEVEKCAWVCEHYAEHGPAMLAPTKTPSDASESFVRYEPLGVVLAVMPWNFPYWQVFRCAAPALMAGNAVVLKHASNVWGCALEIERVFSGRLPAGTFVTLLAPASAVEPLIARVEIAAVSLTGSEPAGVSVGGAAGRALKPSVLELGGSDSFVVLADADFESTLEQAITARVQNNGQSCIAAKRFIVEAPVAEAFAVALADCMRALRVGDPLNRATQVGPLARADLRDDLHAQVARSVERGARILCGGHPVAGSGFFYAPTVLGRVTPGMPAFDEETFGPVAPVIAARDATEAVELANRSRFGLGASVWTRDVARGRSIAEQLEAGSVFVNGIVKSDPRLPFGGIKRSGHGRELGLEGLRSFVNVKTVWVR